MWDLGRGYCTSTLICHSSVNSVRLTMDGFAVVSGHFDGALRFWDLRSGKLANEVAGLHTQQITSVSIGLRSGARRANPLFTLALSTLSDMLQRAHHADGRF